MFCRGRPPGRSDQPGDLPVLVWGPMLALAVWGYVLTVGRNRPTRPGSAGACRASSSRIRRCCRFATTVDVSASAATMKINQFGAHQPIANAKINEPHRRCRPAARPPQQVRVPSGGLGREPIIRVLDHHPPRMLGLQPGEQAEHREHEEPACPGQLRRQTEDANIPAWARKTNDRLTVAKISTRRRYSRDRTTPPDIPAPSPRPRSATSPAWPETARSRTAPRSATAELWPRPRGTTRDHGQRHPIVLGPTCRRLLCHGGDVSAADNHRGEFDPRRGPTDHEGHAARRQWGQGSMTPVQPRKIRFWRPGWPPGGECRPGGRVRIAASPGALVDRLSRCRSRNRPRPSCPHRPSSSTSRSKFRYRRRPPSPPAPAAGAGRRPCRGSTLEVAPLQRTTRPDGHLLDGLDQ